MFQCFKDLDSVRPYITEVSQAKELYNHCVPLGALQEDVAFRTLENFGYEASFLNKPKKKKSIIK